MKRFINTTIKLRLMVGFLICALLTGLSGGAGIWSLKQVQNNMKDTNNAIDANINKQNAQALQLMPLRCLANAIFNAENIQEIHETNKKVLELREKVTSHTDKKTITVFNTVKALSNQKEKQITAKNDLENLQKSTTILLEDIIKKAVATVDTVEFDSIMEINDAMTEISDSYDKMVLTTGNSAST